MDYNILHGSTLQHTNWKMNQLRTQNDCYLPTGALCSKHLDGTFGYDRCEIMSSTKRPSLYDLAEIHNNIEHKVILFHGTSWRAIQNPEWWSDAISADNWKSFNGQANLLGQGFYLTLNPNEALAYAIQTSKGAWANSVDIPKEHRGQPVVIEFIINNANEFKRGGTLDKKTSINDFIQFGALDRHNAHMNRADDGDFIQNPHDAQAKEQFVFIDKCLDKFRDNINVGKTYIHSYAPGTTIRYGNVYQSKNTWATNPYYERNSSRGVNTKTYQVPK